MRKLRQKKLYCDKCKRTNCSLPGGPGCRISQGRQRQMKRAVAIGPALPKVTEQPGPYSATGPAVATGYPPLKKKWEPTACEKIAFSLGRIGVSEQTLADVLKRIGKDGSWEKTT